MTQKFVFLHGWGLNQAVWAPTIGALPPQVSGIALNLPGFGGAPWRAELADINASADTLARQIETSNDAPVHLVGWSLGGLLASFIAFRHPQLVASVYTVASSPCFVAKPEQQWPGIDAQVLAQFQQQLARNYQQTVKRFLAVQAMGSPSAKEDIKALQQRILSQPDAAPDALAAGLRWLAEVDLRDQLNQFSTLQIPWYRAYGRLDSLVPIAVAAAIDHSVQPNTLVPAKVFTQSAHTPFLNQPDEFLTWLLNPSSKAKD